MTALSADRNTKRKLSNELQSYPMYADATIYAGSLVCLNSSGYAIAAADTAGNILVGIARETLANTAAAGYGTSGDISIEVWRAGVFELVGSGLAITDVGSAVYITDDQTVSTTAANVYAGIIANIDSATSVWVDITPATRPAAYTSGALSLTGALTLGVNDTGQDLLAYGATAGSYMLWDESEDRLELDGADINLQDGDFLQLGDAQDIAITWDGTSLKVSQAIVNSAIEFGVDGAGIDIQLFGDTGGCFWLWDQSIDTVLRDGGTLFAKAVASGDAGMTVSADGMTADPETAQEAGYVTIDIGGASYQIPIYAAA